jgi:hypothetical protein
MTTGKIALAVAGVLFAATVLPAVSSAREGGGGGGLARAAHCKEYKQKAMSTGEEYWWRRWRHCLKGWD